MLITKKGQIILRKKTYIQEFIPFCNAKLDNSISSPYIYWIYHLNVK